MKDFTTPSADGTELFGRHWPLETPKAVMALVHGFGEHSGRYDVMAKHLNGAGIAVVAIDWRGHGRSSGKRGVIKSYDDFRADLDVLLVQTRTLYPNTPMVLYGHSMGGAIALDYGARHSGVDALPIIASAPLIILSEPVPKPLRALAKVLGKIRPQGALTQPIDGTKISNLPEQQTAYAEDPLHNKKLGFRLMEGMIANGEQLQRAAKNWDRPLLLLHSQADQLTSFQGSSDFARDAKQVEFHPYETSQHEMHHDEPREEVHALMTEFILKHSQEKSA